VGAGCVVEYFVPQDASMEVIAMQRNTDLSWAMRSIVVIPVADRITEIIK
jgi:hypothetical protein